MLLTNTLWLYICLFVLTVKCDETEDSNEEKPLVLQQLSYPNLLPNLQRLELNYEPVLLNPRQIKREQSVKPMAAKLETLDTDVELIPGAQTQPQSPPTQVPVIPQAPTLPGLLPGQRFFIINPQTNQVLGQNPLFGYPNGFRPGVQLQGSQVSPGQLGGGQGAGLYPGVQYTGGQFLGGYPGAGAQYGGQVPGGQRFYVVPGGPGADANYVQPVYQNPYLFDPLTGQNYGSLQQYQQLLQQQQIQGANQEPYPNPNRTEEQQTTAQQNRQPQTFPGSVIPLPAQSILAQLQVGVQDPGQYGGVFANAPQAALPLFGYRNQLELPQQQLQQLQQQQQRLQQQLNNGYQQLTAGGGYPQLIPVPVQYHPSLYNQHYQLSQLQGGLRTNTNSDELNKEASNKNQQTSSGSSSSEKSSKSDDSSNEYDQNREGSLNDEQTTSTEKY